MTDSSIEIKRKLNNLLAKVLMFQEETTKDYLQ